MNESHQEIINRIGNIYNDFINISINEDLSVLNIQLDEFAQVKLILKNKIQNKYLNLKEIQSKLYEKCLIQVQKVENGYLVCSNVSNKKTENKLILFCEDIDVNIEFWDYSKIKISEDENKENYRVCLAVKEARNLLIKHVLFGDEGLNYIEKDLVRYAILIIVLNLLQLQEQYSDENISNLFKVEDKNSQNALKQALEAIKIYVGKIDGVEMFEQKIEGYLSSQKNEYIYDDIDFEKLKILENNQSHCYYNEPIYKIYADFSVGVKNACKNFKCKHKAPSTKFAIKSEKYIKQKIIPTLTENGFEGQYPCFIYKDCSKLYVISFEVMDNKVVIKYDDKNLELKKIKSLLENVYYKEIKPEDFCVYLTSECLDNQSVGECIKQFLDDLKLHKEIEFDEYSKETDIKHHKQRQSLLDKIFSIFKKEADK